MTKQGRHCRRSPSGVVAMVVVTLSLCVMALGGSSQTVGGQSHIRGEVVSTDPGMATTGVMVIAMMRDSLVARTLTAGEGSFELRLPGPGSYDLRVDRIGFRSTVFGPFDVGSAGDTEVQLRLEAEPVALRGLDVVGTFRCGVSPLSDGATAIVWEEARKALAAAQWTAERELYRLSWWSFERELDGEGRRVERESRQRRRFVVAQPFTSWPVDTLAVHGFVRERDDGLVYAAPDATVLLSTAFAETHCFALASSVVDGRPLVGLRFEPVPGRRLPEVEGVLWLDRETSQLEVLEYGYVNAFTAASDRNIDAGGRVAFRALPNGTWIVDDWHIRMPELAEVHDDLGRVMRYQLRGYSEAGGTVTLVETGAGEVVARGAGSIEGIVTDSLGMPTPDAVVWVLGTDLRTVTDSLGRFALLEMLEGTWSIRASNDGLLLFGHEGEEVEAETARFEVARVQLSLPSLSNVLEQRCAVESQAAARTGGVLAGRVLRGDVAVQDAPVRATWTQSRSAIRASYSGVGADTDRSGTFVLCNVPIGQAISATVSTDRDEVANGEVVIEEGELGATFDLMLYDPAEASAAMVSHAEAPLTWLDSIGVSLRRSRALLSMEDFAGSDSLPGLLADVPGIALRRASSGLLEIVLQDDSTRGPSPLVSAGCVADVYLNGARLLQRTSVTEIDVVRNVDLTELTALEVFRGVTSPIGGVESCGAVLLWAERLREAEDPRFMGDLVGRFQGLAAGADARLITLALTPGWSRSSPDQNGRFEFRDLAPTLYRLDAQIPVWGAWSSPVDIRAGHTVDLVISVDEMGERDAGR